MIYLDNSATTQPCEACVRAMTELLTDCWGNPSSVHAHGIAAHHRLRQAREQVASALGAEPVRSATLPSSPMRGSRVVTSAESSRRPVGVAPRPTRLCGLGWAPLEGAVSLGEFMCASFLPGLPAHPPSSIGNPL